MSGTIGAHGDGGDTCDTFGTTCVPIIFVPGVMGSRQSLTSSRTWDPDSTLTMLRWPPLTRSGQQTNRAALSVSPVTGVAQGQLMTSLSSGAMKAIKSSSTIRDIVLRETGTASLKDTHYQQLYGVTRNWASVVWDNYGSILIALEEAFNALSTEMPVYGFGYDFRQSNADSAVKFKKFVSDTLDTLKDRGATQCIVVTHSMGGFLPRAAFAGDSGFMDKVRGVVHTMHPSNGAVVCYTRFFSGVADPPESLKLKDVPVSAVLGQDGFSYAYNLSGCPGPLQLLPNHRYQQNFTPGKWLDGIPGLDLGDIFSLYASEDPPQRRPQGGLVGIVKFAEAFLGTPAERGGQIVREFNASLAAAKDFHTKTLGGATAGYHPQTIVVFSSGTTTIDAIRFNTDEDPADLDRKWVTTTSSDGTVVSTNELTKVAYTRRPTGDGTVPGVSGKCPESQATPIVAKEALLHADVFKNSAFNQVVVSLVKKLVQCVVTMDDSDSSDAVASDDSTDSEDGTGEDADAAASNDSTDSQDDGQGGDAVASNDGGGGDDSSGADGSDSAVASNDGEGTPSNSAA